MGAEVVKAALIEDKLTPLSADAVARAFASAYRQVLGMEPTVRTLAILMAQSALESGRWKALHCFNFTNIKAVESYEGHYCLYRCNEIINGRVEWFNPPHPQCRFRAFLSVEAGAVDYLEFLTRARYKPALLEAQRGDPRSFVSALKRGGFFTAAEEPYAKAVVSLTSEYERQIQGWLAESPPRSEPIAPPLTEADRARVIAQQFDHLDLDGDGAIDRDHDTEPPDPDGDTIPPPSNA